MKNYVKRIKLHSHVYNMDKFIGKCFKPNTNFFPSTYSQIFNIHRLVFPGTEIPSRDIFVETINKLMETITNKANK